MTDPTDVLSPLIRANLPIFGVVAGLYAVLFLYRRFRSGRKGSLERALVNKGAFRQLDPQLYRSFSDLYLPRLEGDGLTQVDHAVVSPFGIFVVETKNYTGFIQGAEDQAQWTQTFGSGGRFAFPNPIWQNRLHLRALAQFLKLPESKFHSVIYFLGGSTFQTELPGYVIDSGLAGQITGHQEVLLQPDDVAAANVALATLLARTNKRVARRELAAGIEKRRREKG